MWKRLRYRIEWLALSAAASLVPKLPRAFCCRIAEVGGAFFSMFDRAGRRVALDNLECAFGDSLGNKAQLARASYQHFARTMLDLLWSPSLTHENFRHFIELENADVLFTERARKNGVIVACFHYSNFEWLSHACGFVGVEATIITQGFKNARLDPLFDRLREVSGHQVVPRKGGIARLYKALRRGGTTAMLCDLTVKANSEAVIIDSFGLKKSVPLAPAWLQEKTGADIVPAHCEPLARGRYRVVFHEPIPRVAAATPAQVAQRVWDSFEPVVRQNPAPWLWAYKHWRYRPAEATRRYPFYASFAIAFQKTLARSRASLTNPTAPASN